MTEFQNIIGIAKRRMKQILEEEQISIRQSFSFEVSVKYTTSYGVDLEPNFGCQVRMNEDDFSSSIYGYGDTIDAALSDFWRTLREWKLKNEPAFVRLERELQKRSFFAKPLSCLIPCDLGMDGCKCRAQEGGNNG